MANREQRGNREKRKPKMVNPSPYPAILRLSPKLLARPAERVGQQEERHQALIGLATDIVRNGERLPSR